jgi:hypothetical protein
VQGHPFEYILYYSHFTILTSICLALPPPISTRLHQSAPDRSHSIEKMLITAPSTPREQPRLVGRRATRRQHQHAACTLVYGDARRGGMLDAPCSEHLPNPPRPNVNGEAAGGVEHVRMDDPVPLLGRGQDEAPEARGDVPPTTSPLELQSQGTQIKQIVATSVVQFATPQCLLNLIQRICQLCRLIEQQIRVHLPTKS